jgi:ribose transport system permease protein
MSEPVTQVPNFTAPELAAGELDVSPPALPGAWRRVMRTFSFRNASAVYVFVAIFIVFSIWVPSTFLTSQNWTVLLSNEAVTCIGALALVAPLAAGLFDLSIGASIGFGAVLVSWLLVTKGVSLAPAIIITLAAGAAIGVVNALLVIRLRVDSLIATLGMSSVIAALTAWISGSAQIVGLSTTFQDIGSDKIFGIALPVYIMLVVAVIGWYLLERTAVGRRVYAVGGNIESARLSGIRVNWVIVGCLVACGVAGALAGVLEASELGTGDPTIGPSYLLPTFSAAFLGSTQIKAGRFNVWGTVLAVYVIAAGIKGLQLAGAPIWIPDLFNGLALLIAVALARYERAAKVRIRPRGRAAGRTPDIDKSTSKTGAKTA